MRIGATREGSPFAVAARGSLRPAVDGAAWPREVSVYIAAAAAALPLALAAAPAAAAAGRRWRRWPPPPPLPAAARRRRWLAAAAASVVRLFFLLGLRGLFCWSAPPLCTVACVSLSVAPSLTLRLAPIRLATKCKDVVCVLCNVCSH